MRWLRSRYVHAGCALAAAALALVAALWLASRSEPARAASIGQLQQQVGAQQGRVAGLAGALSAASGRLGQLDASVAGLQGRIAVLQADFMAKRAQLFRVRGELTAALARLQQVEAFDAHAESVLEAQVVDSYEADRPDLVTVVLESTGFADLLERLSFEQRIQNQDVQVVRQVRAARRAVSSQATRLGALEVREQDLTSVVFTQRNNLAFAKDALVQQQLAVRRDRNLKAGQLADARGLLASLQTQLDRAQAAAQAAAAAAASASRAVAQNNSSPGGGGSGSSPATPNPGQVSRSGGFTFPLPKDGGVTAGHMVTR